MNQAPKVYFFDMDHTLINADCDVTWKHYLVRHGHVPATDLDEAARFFDDYNAGCLDIEAFFRFQFRDFLGKTEEEMRPLVVEHFHEFIEPHIYREGRELVASLLKEGYPVAILTSTNSVVARPVADALGIPEVYGTTLEQCGGRFTGRVAGTYGVREGKVAVANAWAAERGFALSDFAYYGDSVNDEKILKAVGFPHAVNPSQSLREIAEAEKWPILSWGK